MEYKPLDFASFEFRLLTLLEPETTEAANSIVRCNLTHEFLIGRFDQECQRSIKPRSYRALSYYWGDRSITRPIMVDGHLVQVTTNLEEALRELRLHKVTTLWVDALCINQEDRLEKGLQVTRMALIYSKAIEVFAWLGVEAEDSRKAIRLLRTPVPSTGVFESDTKAISALFRRPYWKRVWIIQEVCKGDKVQVLCGGDNISWPKLASTFQYIKPLVPPEIIAIEDFRQQEITKNRPILADALVRSRYFMSTDIRDKIYAVLGLTSDGNEIVQTPNYVLPPDAIYYQTIREVLARFSDLSYLVRNPRDTTCNNSTSIAHWSNIEEGIPGYLIMNLERKLEATKIETKLSTGVIRVDHGIMHRKTHVYFALPSKTHFAKQDSITLPYLSPLGLNASGFLLDSIDGISSSFLLRPGRQPFQPPDSLSGPANPSLLIVVLRKFWWILTALEPLSPDESYIPDALTYLCQKAEWRLIERPTSQTDHFCNWIRENQNLVYCGQTIRQWIDMHSESKEYQKTYAVGESDGKRTGFRGFFSSHSHSISEHRAKRAIIDLEQHIAEFLKSIGHTVSANLRLAIGKHGQVMGLVPAETRKGDLFLLIRHANLPIIIRQHKDGRYRLIGETTFYPLRPDSPTGTHVWDDWVRGEIKSYVRGDIAYQNFCIY
jgi:hypothetical protein